ncbi:glycerol-3-phosphate dehydrogenase [Fistulifera solaris]|uniref:Glycerol-3-phosphate dehydrogenase n=1 Tax=Fistulifera solaris TaxID=1519565 RepID=A0A1Z5J8G2_FISSO|nr:glycerol-3-phosphate dehydrogenase [Fistulifera solaris]|eukprot:GAX10277.1 glycerol-3-phosphate dehydrogenase [Fistulifera solaris]
MRAAFHDPTKTSLLVVVQRCRASQPRMIQRTFRSHRQTQNNNNHNNNNNNNNFHRDPGLHWTSVISFPQTVPGPAQVPSRGEQIQKLQQSSSSLSSSSHEEYDLLIVGGGATGAGIALDAATRGLRVACVERGDFASETSSRSTKLIWAGIKYMGSAISGLLSWRTLTNPLQSWQNFHDEIMMVYHCHVERRYMMTKQPHLCHWVPLVVPFYAWHLNPPPLGEPLFAFFPILAPLTFKIYDALSFFTCPSSYLLTKNKAMERFPQLQRKDLKYASVFYEAQHNDARTNLAIAMTAADRGATIVNYVEMMDFIFDDQSDKVVGAVVQDRMTGEEWVVRAKKVVLAGGPFTDALRQREMKELGSNSSDQFQPAVEGASGTHIVLRGGIVPDDLGLLDYQTRDGRFLFILPWQGHTLVGTTDQKDPAQTLHNVPEDEIEWLLEESQKYLELAQPLQRSDVWSAWRGWRPLAVDPHAPPGTTTMSRDHIISEHPVTGVLFIAGGKWTTWRAMAQDVTDRVVARLSLDCTKTCETLDIALHGAEGYSEGLWNQVLAKYKDMDEAMAKHLVETYGGLVWEVLACRRPGGRWDEQRLVPGYPYIDAEVIYACREYACTVEDVLSRRTRLAFLNKEAAQSAIRRVADVMAQELQWSPTVKEQQIVAAQHYIETYGGPKSS